MAGPLLCDYQRGGGKPSLFGEPHAIPVDLSAGAGQHSLSNVVSEHMNHHPESDLMAVLTGRKAFREALE
jgi:hypothetical protein